MPPPTEPVPLLSMIVSVTASCDPAAGGLNRIPRAGEELKFMITQFSMNNAAPLTKSMPTWPPVPLNVRLRIFTTIPLPLMVSTTGLARAGRTVPGNPLQSMVIDLLIGEAPEKGPESRQLTSPPSTVAATALPIELHGAARVHVVPEPSDLRKV